MQVGTLDIYELYQMDVGKLKGFSEVQHFWKFLRLVKIQVNHICSRSGRDVADSDGGESHL